jgi:hypothetical protein
MFKGTLGGAGGAVRNYGIYLTGEDSSYFSAPVGIGVGTPTAKLHITSADATNPAINVLNTVGHGGYITTQSVGKSSLGLFHDSSALGYGASNTAGGGILTLNATGIDLGDANAGKRNEGAEFLACWDGSANKVYNINTIRGTTLTSYASSDVGYRVVNNNATSTTAATQVSMGGANTFQLAASGGAVSYYTSKSHSWSRSVEGDEGRYGVGALSNSGTGANHVGEQGIAKSFRIFHQSSDDSGVSFVNGNASWSFCDTGSFIPSIGGSNMNLGINSATNTWDNVYSINAATTTSDKNAKSSIKASDLGLEFINKLNPVRYKWKNYTTTRDVERTDADTGEIVEVKEEKTSHTFKRTHYGLIAQDVKSTLDSLSIDTKDFAGYIDGSVKGGESTLGLRYNEFMSPLIKAVQELSQKVDDQAAEIEALKAS